MIARRPASFQDAFSLRWPFPGLENPGFVLWPFQGRLGGGNTNPCLRNTNLAEFLPGQLSVAPPKERRTSFADVDEGENEEGASRLAICFPILGR